MNQYQSENITELAKALLSVQRTVRPIAKDAENPFTKSWYASLNSVMDACRDALIENGIWLCQYPVPVEQPNSLGCQSARNFDPPCASKSDPSKGLLFEGTRSNFSEGGGREA